MSEGVKREVMDALRGHFRPEFLNRVDDIIIFHALTREQMRTIIDIQLRGLVKRLEDRKIHVELTDSAKDLIIEEGYDPTYGARPLKRTIQRRILDPLAISVLQGDFREGDRVRIDVKAGRSHLRESRTGYACRAELVAFRATMSDTTPPAKNRRSTERRTGPRGAPGSAVWYVLGFLLLLALAQAFFFQLQSGETICLQRLQVAASAKDKVQEVTLSEDRIRGLFKVADGGKGKPFSAVRVTDAKLPEELEAHGVKYTGEIANRWVTEVLGWVIPLLFIVGLWTFFLRRMGGAEGGVMSFARSKAKIYADDDVKVSFGDVAGVDEAEEELKEIVEFLKTPRKYTAIGGKIPKGVLLVGPPGTGKTLLARAVAGEAKVPFFSLSGSEFVEMFVGVGAARVRDLFSQAEAKAPCIVFIDELDALGKVRQQTAMGGHEEREQTLNQLLAEMDGFDGRKGIIIMGATNRPEVLDPALLRPGRFDRQVLVDKPDVRGREDILAHPRQDGEDRRRRGHQGRSRSAPPGSPARISRTWSTRPRCSRRARTRPPSR